MLKEDEIKALVNNPVNLETVSEDVIDQVVEYYMNALQQHINTVSYKTLESISTTTTNLALPKAAFALKVKEIIKKGLGTYLKNKKWTTNVKLTPYLIRTISNLGKLEVEKSNGRDFHKRTLVCPACKNVYGIFEFINVCDKVCYCKNCEDNIEVLEKELASLKAKGN